MSNIYTTGTINLMPVAYANVNADGNANSTYNCTVGGTNPYKITVSGYSGFLTAISSATTAGVNTYGVFTSTCSVPVDVSNVVTVANYSSDAGNGGPAGVNFTIVIYGLTQ